MWRRTVLLRCVAESFIRQAALLLQVSIPGLLVPLPPQKRKAVRNSLHSDTRAIGGEDERHSTTLPRAEPVDTYDLSLWI